MRVLAKLILGLVAIVALGAGALVVLLPRLIDSEVFRAAVSENGRQLLGREVRFEALAIGLFPPSLVVTAPEISGPTPTDPPLLRAGSVQLRLALLPLFSATVEVDSLVVRAAVIELERTDAGLSLPTPPPERPAMRAPTPRTDVMLVADTDTKTDTNTDTKTDAKTKTKTTPSTAGAVDGTSDSPFAMAIRSVAIPDAKLILVDRVVKPPVRWVVDPLSLKATGTGPDAPIALAMEARIATGGRVGATGTMTLAGDMELEISLDEIDLAAAAPYVGPSAKLDAELSGQVVAFVRESVPGDLTVVLKIDSKEIAIDDLLLTGDILIGAELDGDAELSAGVFELDATGAALIHGEAFRKPSAVIATAKGRFAIESNGALQIEIERAQLKNMKTTASVRAAESISVSADIAPFDLRGWGALLPALEPYDVGGSVAIRGLTLESDPLAIHGQIVLDDVALDLPEADVLTIRGRVVGKGDGIGLVDFDLEAGNQHLSLSGDVWDLSGDQPFSVAVRSVGVLSTNELLGALSSLEDTLHGPLLLEGKLRGRAAASGSETALLDSLKGSFSFSVGKRAGEKGVQGGRLTGVSALRGVYDGLQELEQAARLATMLAGVETPDLERFMGDEFEYMEGRFSVASGLLETSDLRIVYRDYGVNLRGAIALATQEVDMTGEVELGSGLVAALGSQAADREVVVPLAHVGGTVAELEFSVSPQAASALSKQLLARNRKVNESLDGIGKKADEYVPGASELLKKGLGGLLGGH